MLQRYLQEGRVEAGCDEAGRGCLAGPVTAAAVILPPDFSNELLNDSKQLTEHQRDTLRPIIEREALAWAVAMVSPQEIDTINILRASFIAMHRALDQLTVRPEHILVDGNRFIPYSNIPFTTIIKGDGNIGNCFIIPFFYSVPVKSTVIMLNAYLSCLYASWVIGSPLL